MEAAEVFQVDVVTALTAQVESLRKKIDGKMTPWAAPVKSCETCNGGHPTTNFPIFSVSSREVEQVDFVSDMNQPQGNPYSTTYNPV